MQIEEQVSCNSKKMKNMPNLNIDRLSGFVDMARDYEIHIDGVFSGVISNSSSEIFTITPGIHFVSVKVGWSSSLGREIELKENMEIFFKSRLFKDD